MDDATQDIRDFFKAVDSGWLGPMPSGFNQSAFVVALRSRLQPAAASERDDIIEMCRQVATDAAENEDLILKNFAGRPELVGVWQDACNYVFAKLGSLKSQPEAE